MKKNHFVFPGWGKTRNTEDHSVENERLREKLKELTGQSIRLECEKLPEEVENRMLESVLQFEEAFSSASEIPVYDFLGKPSFIDPKEIKESELEKALIELDSLFLDRNIILDMEGIEDGLERYQYITEVFFQEKIRNLRIPGIYFRFHVVVASSADPEQAIRASGRQFMTGWAARKMDNAAAMLGKQFILEDGTSLTREQVLEKFRLMFDSFTALSNWNYTVEEVKYEYQDPYVRGVGLLRGQMAYDALLESGEMQHFEGPYILFFTLRLRCWRVFYFIVPGFKW